MTNGERLSKLGAGPTWIGGAHWWSRGRPVRMITFLDDPSTEPATYAAVLAGIVTGAGLGLGLFAGYLPGPSARPGPDVPVSPSSPSSSNVSLMVIGAVSQPNGVDATVSGEELRGLKWPNPCTIGFWLLFVLVVVSWRRVQERLALREPQPVDPSIG